MLRPGGREATDRIIKASHIKKETKVLEVAPNMGTTAIYLAKTFGCHVTGVDIHAESVEKARRNVENHGLEGLIDIQHGNAMNLPFEDNTFDVIINEAMLTMLQGEQKKKALSEYYRVLKPEGVLGTHDLLIRGNMEDEGVKERLQELRKLLHVNAQPLSEQSWCQLIKGSGFQQLISQTGKMSLLSLRGLIIDEGWDGIIKMIENARRDKDDEAYLFELIENFDKNDDLYGHITVIATK